MNVPTTKSAAPEPAARCELSVRELAGLIEHRLHWTDLTERQFIEGCHYAANAGLAAVLCRPEQVALATRVVAGTATKVITALGYHDPNAPTRRVDLLTEQAADLASQGADEVCLLAAPGAVAGATADVLVDQLTAVRQSVAAHGATVRVALNCKQMSAEQVTETCRRLTENGVAAVQAGSIRGDRASFERVETMRAALPRPILLKWTQPLKALEAVLVCVSLGVDRFNGDPRQLLKTAERSAQIGPLTIPAAGTA